ncbi:hypothetical protein BS47DRAFT_1348370 [Hydnum rufescens UP504]|uniref:NADH dehydrogenase [ubiquinone] iron-sulfur protein 4, mitochondrial n=1 Tax=Hydnum rufescens UP504 TaxID=1448309 RepID=A0A9P6DT25_9AGAM|nr:hypothetical protein BS47DRAFT_1348370 [Hydnum rufescens UP504]
MALFTGAQRTLSRVVSRAPVTVRHYTAIGTSSAHPSAQIEAQPNPSLKEITTNEHKDLVTAEVISGAPEQLQHRSVRIYQPTRNTMQSGGTKGEKWRIDFDVLQGGGRWENPLMGWASSADYMQGTRMSFNTKEDAIHFAEKQGWDYYVQPSTVKRIPPKNYAENYVYRPAKLRIAHTK